MMVKHKGLSNAQRFLDAFAEVERLLRSETRSPVDKNMVKVIEEASLVNATVNEYQLELTQYSRLRNALSHDRLGGCALAEPRDDVVRNLTHILQLLASPPLVGQVFSREVTVFSDNDPVMAFASKAWSHCYSQAPVYSQGRFRGLLASDTLARWLGSGRGSNIQSLEQVTIGEVLECAESGDNYEFASARTPVADVGARFEQAVRQGRRLDAVLITDNGTDAGTLLGIVTAWDLPRAFRCLRGMPDS